MKINQPSPYLVATLATLTAVLATGVAGFLLEQNLALQKLLAEPPVRVQHPLEVKNLSLWRGRGGLLRVPLTPRFTF